MYPLLVSGITSVATNLLDTWNRASERKAETERINFQEVLDRVAGPAKATGDAAVTKTVNPRAARIAELHAALLDSPEVRALLETSDPAQPATLQLGPDGQLTAQTAGGWPRALQVSAETQAQAQELARLLANGSGFTGMSPAMKLSR
ncbi:MAG: hypothetical protein K8R23_20090 [Chthoniobacter sp.]|nr:hypothetical protein [Chthoniobacter sp.]